MYSWISNPKTCPLGFRMYTTQPFNIRLRICYRTQENFILTSAVCHKKLKNVLSSSLILDKRNIKKTTPAFISLVQTIFILTVVSTRQFSGDRTPWGFSVISGQIIWYVAMEAIWYICKINTSEIWQIPISGHLDICDNTQFNKFSFYKLLGEVMFKVEKKKVELGRIIMSVPR